MKKAMSELVVRGQKDALFRRMWTNTSPRAEPARSTLEKVRAMIRSAAPAEATEVISLPDSYRSTTTAVGGLRRIFKPLQLVPHEWPVLRALKGPKDFQPPRAPSAFPVEQAAIARSGEKVVRARLAEKQEKLQRRSGCR